MAAEFPDPVELDDESVAEFVVEFAAELVALLVAEFVVLFVAELVVKIVAEFVTELVDDVEGLPVCFGKLLTVPPPSTTCPTSCRIPS